MNFVRKTHRPILSDIHPKAARSRLLVFPFAAAALALTAGCSDLADPGDYGGGAEGTEFAQCVTRTQDDNSSLTRDEAETLCTCLNERIAEGTEQPISDGTVDRAETQRALMRCAADEGIAVE